MLDPITNAISAARSAAVRRERRVLSERSAPGRDGDQDRFDSALEQAQAAQATRPLADAGQEEAIEDQAEMAHDAARPEPPGRRLDLTA
jgi:Tfp pilus assembly protein FimT